MDKEKIEKINALYKKQKEKGLSDEEKKLQKELRREYIKKYKENLRSQLDNTYIKHEDGRLEKLKPKGEKDCE